MAAELEVARHGERQFLLSVSHDLRTPLTSIRGYADALTDGTIPATDEQRRAGAVIAAEANRLERLVADLLDLARIDAHQFSLSPRPFDVRRDGADRGRGVPARGRRPRHRARRRRARPSCAAVGDPDRVAQIVANLVENALKYARRRITVTVAADGRHEVTIRVVDDGPGIDPGEEHRVFERLYVSRTVAGPQRRHRTRARDRRGARDRDGRHRRGGAHGRGRRDVRGAAPAPRLRPARARSDPAPPGDRPVPSEPCPPRARRPNGSCATPRCSPRWRCPRAGAAGRAGLLGRDGIDGVMLLRPCRNVHTFRMRFAIDVAFCDRDDVVLRTTTLAPGRISPVRVAGRVRPRGRGRRVRAVGRCAPATDWSSPVSEACERRRRPGGALVLVGTPIGNLGDLSPRAWSRCSRPPT